MSDDIDNSTGRDAIAYFGETPWHRKGTPGKQEWSLDQWIDAASLGYEVVRVPAYADIGQGDNVHCHVPLENAYFNMRSDTKAILGNQTHTERRVEVQPRELIKFVHDYVTTDDRFTFQVLGAIKKGAQIWATAAFNGTFDIGGDKHQAYLLARTGFDGSLATHLYMTTVRAVCRNTLALGWDRRAMVSLRHTQKFNPQQAAKQLAAMAQSVEDYQAIGNALAQAEMSREQVADFFKQILDIPAELNDTSKLSTRKANQYKDLGAAYRKSVEEGCGASTPWACLQAVTRYVDHDRSTRNTNGDADEAQFVSSQFGSGAALKGKAMGLLLPMIKDKVAIAA